MVNIRKAKNALKFSKPAGWWGSTWREGLPSGNGVIGTSVLGGAANDVVLINHSDLWWQGHVGVLQDVADKLPNVRKKIEEHKPKEAEQILSEGLIQKGFRPRPAFPLPLCDFKIHQHFDKAVKEYARVLNMENGEVSVTMKDATTRFERSMFVSRAKQDIICYEFTKTGPKLIDVTLSLNQHDTFNTRTLDAVSTVPSGVNVKYEEHFMYYSARSDNQTDFGVVAHVRPFGGTSKVIQNGIHIKGAEKILVILKPFIESQREKAWNDAKKELPAVAKLTYDKLLKEHTTIHNKLFNSAELDLEADNRDEFADVLLDTAMQKGEMPLALIEKMWAYGRYLLLSGSSPLSRPLAPHGLWCGDYKADSASITAAGSIQSTYAHAFSGNMAEFAKSIFTYYESVLADLRKNASRLYLCKGIFVPSVMAHGTGVLGSVDPGVIHFTGCAGWICQLYYDYYRFTEDKAFLKKQALPFMKETAAFYENFFKVLGDGMYESVPSFSPNTSPSNFVVAGEPMHIARNATVDFTIARELLKNLIEGSEIAGENKGDIAKWKDMLTKIPGFVLETDGTVREYQDPKYNDNPLSPSTALMYPCLTGIGYYNMKPENKKAFELTAKKKLTSANQEFTSPELMRYANIFARFGDGETALEIMTNAVRSMAMNNLVFAKTDWRGMGSGKVDTWASYTVEPNASLTSAVQEMIVQSSGNTIKLLPALPGNMGKGSIEGFLTRAGVEIVLLEWDSRKGNVTAKIKAKKATKINIQLPKGTKRFNNNKPINKEKFDSETGLVSGLELQSGKVISLDIRM
ncbi:MAG: glycoside hydrolase N-terminal domain-containing protein [Firmicutes bacterium]|nr:glycoside hydrolase N-terminal domain-containing protein [Bacillota bacterium]